MHACLNLLNLVCRTEWMYIKAMEFAKSYVALISPKRLYTETSHLFDASKNYFEISFQRSIPLMLFSFYISLNQDIIAEKNGIRRLHGRVLWQTDGRTKRQKSRHMDQCSILFRMIHDTWHISLELRCHHVRQWFFAGARRQNYKYASGNSWIGLDKISQRCNLVCGYCLLCCANVVASISMVAPILSD